MKDSLTVKELANENNDSLSACDNSFNDNMPKHFCLEQSKDNLAKHDGEKSFDKNAEESIESMSQIEAELEAELVRMGLNMNSSSLERRLSDFVEASVYVKYELISFKWHDVIVVTHKSVFCLGQCMTYLNIFGEYTKTLNNNSELFFIIQIMQNSFEIESSSP